MTLMDAFAKVSLFPEAIRYYNLRQGVPEPTRRALPQPLYDSCRGDLITAQGMSELSWNSRKKGRAMRLSKTLAAVDLAIVTTVSSTAVWRPRFTTCNYAPPRRFRFSDALAELSLAAQSSAWACLPRPRREREHYMMEPKRMVKLQAP